MTVDRSQPEGSHPSVVQHRLVVMFVADAHASEDERAQRAEQLAAGLPGGRLVRVSRRGRAIIAVADDAELDALAASVSEEPDVDYAEPDVIDRAV